MDNDDRQRLLASIAGKHLKTEFSHPASLNEFVEEVLRSAPNYWSIDIRTIVAAQTMLASRGPERIQHLMDALHLVDAIQQSLNSRSVFTSEDRDQRVFYGARALFTALSRGHLDLSEIQLIEILKFAGRQTNWSALSITSMLGMTERFVASNGLTPDIRTSLARLTDKLEKESSTAEARKLIDRIQLMLGQEQVVIPIKSGEPWADVAIAFLQNLSPKSLTAWNRLLLTSRKASGSAPSKKFVATAHELILAIGLDAFQDTLRTWLHAVLTQRSLAVHPTDPGKTLEASMDVDNADVLKGLVWATASLKEIDWATTLGDVAEHCYKKLPWFGPRCAKLANACVAVLSMMKGKEAASQLARLNQSVKQPTGKKMAQKAIGRFAERVGQTIEQIEEENIPTHGLNERGERVDTVGAYVITTRLGERAEVDVSIVDETGKKRKDLPPAIKTEHKKAWQELKAMQKQLATTVSAQRARLDQLLLQTRQWPVAAWRKLYLFHPVLGQLARRLIWRIDDQSFVYAKGQLLNVTGKPVTFSHDAVVRPWHPAQVDPGEVSAWRVQLEQLGITQPFKQAHREIYVLTDAERLTETYSNRFAAHIIRQHQFSALCQQRGWTYRLQGGFDSGGGQPRRDLPAFDLVAEFWVDILEDHHQDEPMSDMGIYLHTTTDQVRFLDRQSLQPVPLESVPPIVFSEILRDVDLFVGVASVGNDPTWQDGGPQGRYQAYWHHYSFGDLSETARTRRAVLESLLPRLTTLKGKWSLSDKFLVIKGSLRTYKIHLGSGNILMEPNDQYLCIVPDRSTSALENDKVFLPFEGDSTLTVILSKAFLLADDSKIKDATITRQIKTDR